MVTALILSFLLGPAIIRWLRALRFGQVIRTDGPERHLGKAGTPTMGGVLILIATAVSTLLWAELTNRYVQVRSEERRVGKECESLRQPTRYRTNDEREA